MTKISGDITSEDDKDEAIIVDYYGTLNYDGELDDAIGIITAMAYQNGYKVLIMTERQQSPEEDGPDDWLSENGISYDELFINIPKLKVYNEFIEPNYKVKFVLDDDKEAINLWRALKLKCLDCKDVHYGV